MHIHLHQSWPNRHCHHVQGLSFDSVEMQRLEGVKQTAGVEVRKAKEEVERLSHEVASEF